MQKIKQRIARNNKAVKIFFMSAEYEDHKETFICGCGSKAQRNIRKRSFRAAKRTERFYSLQFEQIINY
jgi:hypothetical protein